MSWFIDEKYAPILVFHNYDVPTDVELETYIDQVIEVTRRARRENRRFVAIVLFAALPNAAQRARYAKAHERVSPDETRRIIGTFLVVTNPVARGMITAMSWFMPDQMRSVRPAGSYRDCFEQAVELLRAEGMPVPINVDELRAELLAADRRMRDASG